MKKTGPYLGVTGITSLEEMVLTEQMFRDVVQNIDFGLRQELKFMAGVLVSSKTLLGDTNSYPNRYPRIEDLSTILALRHPHLLRTVHYSTDDHETVFGQLEHLLGRAPGRIDALQLNMRWANPVMLQSLRRHHPNLRIILQIGKRALEDVTDAKDVYIGTGLKSYEGLVDDFLIDPSGGKGKDLDVWQALACLLDKSIPAHMRGGVAGGLTPDNLDKLTGLMRRYGPVSIDVETGTRTETDALDMTKTKSFIERGVGLLDRMYRLHRTLRATPTAA